MSWTTPGYKIIARRNGGAPYIQTLEKVQVDTLSAPLQYTGRTYLVTGGLSGIGYEDQHLAGRTGSRDTAYLWKVPDT